jgi:hypothetical protein
MPTPLRAQTPPSGLRRGALLLLLALVLASPLAPAPTTAPAADIIALDSLLDALDAGAPTTGVIVTLHPTAAAEALAAQSQLSPHHPADHDDPPAYTFYDLQDPRLRQRLHATVSQAVDLAIAQLAAPDLTVTHRFAYQFGFAAQVTAAALERLLAHPAVSQIEPDRPLQAAAGTDPVSAASLITAWEAVISQRAAYPDAAPPALDTGLGADAPRGPAACDADLPALAQAAANATAAGISLFAPAGDEGDCFGLAWPACLSTVNAIGAVYATDLGPVAWCVAATST